MPLRFGPFHGVLAAALCTLFVACAAQRVLFTPTADQRIVLGEPPIDLSVVVIQWSPAVARGRNAGAYAMNAAKLLESSQAFRSVVYDPTGRATVGADLVAESAGDYCNTAVIPLVSIVTLGIIPTIWDERQCSGVVFRRARFVSDDSTQSIAIHETLAGKAVLGWVAAPLGLFPAWSWHVGAGQPSYQQAFRLAIIARKHELLRLAAKEP